MLIRCPTCQKQLQVPDTAVGAKVRCPACQAVFAAAPPAPAVELPPAVEPAPPAAAPQPRVEQGHVCPACRNPVHVADEFKGQRVGCPTCGATFVVTLFDIVKLVDLPNSNADEPEPVPFDFNELASDQAHEAEMRTSVYKSDYYKRLASWYFHASAAAIVVNIVALMIWAAIRNDEVPGAMMIGCLLSVGALVPFPFFIAAGNEVRHLERRYMTITGIVFAFLMFASGAISCCSFALDPAAAMGRQPGVVVLRLLTVTIQSILTLLAGTFSIKALAQRS